MKKSKKVLDSMTEKTSSKIISWQAPEFIEYKKNTGWYVILIVVGIVLAIAFYFMANYLAIVVVALAVMVIIITGKQKAKQRFYKLSSEGLKINEKFYPMNEFKSFFISYVGDTANLHLEKTKKFSPTVNTFLVGVNENEVIDFIKSCLPENTKISTTASDLFSNWFKF